MIPVDDPRNGAFGQRDRSPYYVDLDGDRPGCLQTAMEAAAVVALCWLLVVAGAIVAAWWAP